MNPWEKLDEKNAWQQMLESLSAPGPEMAPYSRAGGSPPIQPMGDVPLTDPYKMPNNFPTAQTLPPPSERLGKELGEAGSFLDSIRGSIAKDAGANVRATRERGRPDLSKLSGILNPRSENFYAKSDVQATPEDKEIPLPIVPSPLEQPAPIVDATRDKPVDITGFLDYFKPTDIESEKMGDIEGEVKLASEMQKEKPKAATKSAEKEPSVLEKSTQESAMVKKTGPTELERAQQARDKTQEYLSMLKGMTQIATSVATQGRNTQLPKDYLEDAMAMAERNVTNLKEQQQQRMDDMKERMTELAASDMEDKSDPSSDVSKLYRENLKNMATSAGLNVTIPEGSSAKSLEKIFPILTNLISAKSAQDARKEVSNMKLLDKKLRDEEKADTRKYQETAKESDRVAKIDKELQYSLTRSNVEGLRKKLAEGQQNGLWDVEAIYAFIKAIDPGSVVREGEVKLFEGAEAFFDHISNKPRQWMSGQLQSNIFRKKLMESLEKIAHSREQNFKTQTQSIYNRAKTRELPIKEVFGEYSDIFEKPSSQNNDTGESERVKIRNIETGEMHTVPKANLQKAVASGKYEEVR